MSRVPRTSSPTPLVLVQSCSLLDYAAVHIGEVFHAAAKHQYLNIHMVFFPVPTRTPSSSTVTVNRAFKSRLGASCTKCVANHLLEGPPLRSVPSTSSSRLALKTMLPTCVHGTILSVPHATCSRAWRGLLGFT